MRLDSRVHDLLTHIMKLNVFGVAFLRFALVIVLLWIGGIKFADYEAESIVPFVANSPLMSFFYRHPAPEYRQYLNREGEWKYGPSPLA